MSQPIPTHNGDITGGLSSKTIIAISISGFIILFTTLAIIVKASFRPDNRERDGALRNQQDNKNDTEEYERALEDADVSTLNRAQRRARAKHRMKKNRRLAPHEQPQPANPPPQPGQDNQNDEQQQIPLPQILAPPPLAEYVEEGDNASSGGIIKKRSSRKERQRAAKAEERRERLEYVEERKRQVLIMEQKRNVDENKTDEKDRQEKLQLIEIEKKEALEREYREWHLMFPPSIHLTHNENDDDAIMDSDSSQPETVEQFLSNLYAEKRISLAQTAQRHSVSITTVRRRLKQLEEEGRLQHHGIFDEVRGEYIVVTSEDMEELARYIEEVGCVTLEMVRSHLMKVLDSATKGDFETELTLVNEKNNQL